MLLENNRFRDFLGVTVWHKAGYTGSRVKACCGEDNAHGHTTEFVFHEVAPDCEITYFDGISSNGSYDAFQENIPTLSKYHVGWTSVSRHQDGSKYNDALRALPYLTYFMAGGNNTEGDVNQNLKCDYIYGVGAYRLMVDGQIIPQQYTADTDLIDFCAPDGWWYPNGQLAGMSFATPTIAGMAALFIDFMIDKTGKAPSREMVIQFLKDCARDVYTAGKDTKTGWGAPILPDPATIDISKYTEEPMKIILTIGSNIMTVDGIAKALDQAPIIDPKSNRTLVPLRAISEALGCAVEWNNDTRQVIITAK